MVTADLNDRAKVVEVALGAQPSPQFLSDLFDVGVASVSAAVAAKAAEASESTADEVRSTGCHGRQPRTGVLVLGRPTPHTAVQSPCGSAAA